MTQPVSISSAVAASQGSALVGAAGTYALVLTLLGLHAAGVHLPGGAAVATGRVAQGAVLAVVAAALLAVTATGLRRVWRADRRVGAHLLAECARSVCGWGGALAAAGLVGLWCPSDLGLLAAALAGLVAGDAVGVRLRDRALLALLWRKATPASFADATPAEQAEATRDACAPAEEARS